MCVLRAYVTILLNYSIRYLRHHLALALGANQLDHGHVRYVSKVE